jgi:hypothetical protein
VERTSVKVVGEPLVVVGEDPAALSEAVVGEDSAALGEAYTEEHAHAVWTRRWSVRHRWRTQRRSGRRSARIQRWTQQRSVRRWWCRRGGGRGAGARVVGNDSSQG